MSLLSPSEKYYKQGGNELLVPSHLPELSLCIDFGGYLGEWVESCLSQCGDAQIIVFEPVVEYASYLRDKFTENPQVEILEVALSENDGHRYISLDGAASSLLIGKFHEPQSNRVKIRTKEYSFLSEIVSGSRISWVKMNIEGSEYELIRYFSSSNLIKLVDTFVIQFHQVDGESLADIRSVLEKTHTMSWGFDYVWERWDLKKVTA